MTQFTIRGGFMNSPRRLVIAETRFQLLAAVMDEFQRQQELASWQKLWFVEVHYHAGSRLVCDVCFDGTEVDAEKVEAFLVNNLDRLCLLMPSARCVHGGIFPCTQCNANRRWNAASGGKPLSEYEFRKLYTTI